MVLEQPEKWNREGNLGFTPAEKPDLSLYCLEHSKKLTQ